MNNNTEKQREVFYDALRIIAIFFVLYNHNEGFHYYLEAKATGVTQLLYIAVSVLTKMAVPLFFMISGALLLGKEESVKEILCKRVARFVTILVAFSLLTVGILVYMGNSFTFQSIVKGLLNNRIPFTISYNFLYSYIGMLLLLPFLRKIAINLKKQEVILLVVIYLLLSAVLPCLRLFYKYLFLEDLRIAYPFMVTFGSFEQRSVFYPLLGYWLNKNINVDGFTKKQLGLLIFSVVITMGAMSCMSIAQYRLEGKYTQNFLGCFNFCTAVPVFLLVKYAFHREIGFCGSARFKSFISTVGPLTFFVYLMDELFRYLYLYSYFKLIKQVPVFGSSPFLYSVGWCVISITVLASVAAVLRKNSLLKKISLSINEYFFMLDNRLEKIWSDWGFLNILYFIYLFFFFCPDYFQNSFIKWMNYSLMAMAGLILYIRNYRPGKIAQLSLLFMTVGVGLSFFHHLPNANLMMVLRALRQLMLVFYTDYMLQDNRPYVIRTFFYVLLFWVGMSIISVFAFPKGIYVEYDSNKFDKWVYSVNWLYGHKNNHALTFMIFQIFAWLAYEYKQVFLNAKLLCFLGILPVVASLIMRSVTTFVATLLVFMALILGFRLWHRELPRLKLEHALSVFLGLVLVYIALSMEAVKQIIGFDYSALISLNGRNYIWTHVLRLVPEHLFFGIGLIDFARSIELLANKSFLHAHNTFLDILWKGGIFYLLFFLHLVYSVCAYIRKVADGRIYNILVLCFLALLAELSMESYLQEGKLFLLLLLLSYIAEVKQADA